MAAVVLEVSICHAADRDGAGIHAGIHTLEGGAAVKPTARTMTATYLAPPLAILLGLCGSIAHADDSGLKVGRYKVTVTLEMPHVVTGIKPSTVLRCITPEDVHNGSAFGVLGENPIKACPVKDYILSENRAVFRIECRGPNAASGVAVFEVTPGAYRGVIDMNMGGKNMTMSERQSGTWIGECP